jgi:uncharacterized phage protein gp47/JayE
VEKAAKQLACGLLSGILESGGDFYAGACVVVHSTILSAKRTQCDLSKLTERVIGVVLQAGRERECNLDYLTRLVTRAAAEAAGSFPDEDVAPMERMVLGLLAGQVPVPEAECRWQ